VNADSTQGKAKKKKAFFSVDSALLEELGERLVSRPEIALSELIKNAYDADANECRIRLPMDEDVLVVTDTGVGMTEERFLTRWMTIGTKNKAQGRYSEKYRRPYVGSKGVGRFAARFLGHSLQLTSVAFDKEKHAVTTLSATFDWTKSTKAGTLQRFEIPYSVEITPGAAPGTTLTIANGPQITSLRGNLKEVKSSVFQLTSPLDGLERPLYYRGKTRTRAGKDPGFSILFDDSEEDTLRVFSNLQEKILARFVARVRIAVSDGVADLRVEWAGKGVVYDKRIRLKKYYSGWVVQNELFLDVRFFPRRAGVFHGAEVDGRQAMGWLRDNGGVAVIDNKFRVSPYGQRGDDWLAQDGDVARNRRAWRSPLVASLFPMPPTAMTVARDNPMLYLPQAAQVIGAVFIAPMVSLGGDDDARLVQAINREGFLENKAFGHLKGITRTAIEIIAHYDHKFAREKEEEEYRDAVKAARGDIASAIREIVSSKVIAPDARERLVLQLKAAQGRIVETEKYTDTVRQSLEQMSLLGVLAGFLTHEFEKTLFRLDGALATLKRLSRVHDNLKDDVNEFINSRRVLGSYLDYARLFTTAVGENIVTPFEAMAQIQLVLQTLSDYREKHDITVTVDGSKDIEIKNVPLAAYSGIVMNLVTNAFKAIVARSDKGRREVRITASQAGNRHVLTVSDTGIGIPASLRNRIWDPLYSTTRNENTSLGSGMGLGLTLVRRVVSNIGGRAKILEISAPGFSTTFQVDLPNPN